MKININRGDTWRPILTITEDEEPMDCTDYTVKLWIKETLKETAPEIQELDIDWIDQAGGVGIFYLTHEMSVDMLGRYQYEVVLYEQLSLDVVKTLIQNKLIVRETLEVDL